MKKSRFSEHQLIKILKEVEAGRSAKEVCREHGISNATYDAWKSRYGGMEASDIRCNVSLSTKMRASSKCTRT